jgi:hypothetical protein
MVWLPQVKAPLMHVTKQFVFSGEVWCYSGAAAWYFVTLGEVLSNSIKDFAASEAAAWGSIRVVVNVNDYHWETSIFPDKKRSSYLLPLKKAVRKVLNLHDGEQIEGVIEIKRVSFCI